MQSAQISAHNRSIADIAAAGTYRHTMQTQRNTIHLPSGTFTFLDHAAPDQRDAPIVLCVHGFPDHARSFDALAPLLCAAGYRCVAPWLRGYAPSTLAGPFHMGQIADDILALRRALSPDAPMVLVGHDWGAVASYVALAREPSAFSHAITMAVPHPRALLANLRRHPEQLRLSWYMAFFQLPGMSDAVVRRDSLAFVDRLWRDWSPGYEPPIEAMRDLKRCLQASLPAPLAYYRTMFSVAPAARERTRKLLSETRAIAVPTLYLHGAADGCMLYAMADGQERWFPTRYETQCLPDAGHFLHQEKPTEVADAMLHFLGR